MARDFGLDRVRGLAVVLLLVDHPLVLAQSCGAGWVVYVRLALTRPSLPLFMLVSGALLWRRCWRPGWLGVRVFSVGAFRRQAVRVLPWALVALGAGAAVPGFGVDPLTSYLVALPFVAAAVWSGVLLPWVVAAFLGSYSVPAAAIGYSPWYVGGWVLLGCLVERERSGRWSAWGGGLPRWLEVFGCWSVQWYVAELVLLAAVAVGVAR